MFVAKISRGRTINELFVGFLLLPSLVTIIWFSTWGGIGIRQARQGQELAQLGMKYYNDSGRFLVNGTTNCYHVPQHDIIVDGEVVFHNHLIGVTPVCQFDTARDSWALFNVVSSFSYPDTLRYGMGPTLLVVTFVLLSLFYINTFSVSTLMMHYLSSNGKCGRYDLLAPWYIVYLHACVVVCMFDHLLHHCTNLCLLARLLDFVVYRP
jgi:choline-glycine betaine transporter